MSNLPVDPYNRGYIVEPPIDNPDRAPLGGTGKDFVVTLSDNTETPGSDMMFLSRSGKWVPFKTTDLVTWGSIAGDITEQADLMAMFAQYTPTTGYARVAFTGNYNDLSNLPPLGTVSPLDLDGSTSRFLRGDGVWAIPVDVNAQWGNITGNINAQTDLIALLNLKAPITSPVFQGNPQAPTPPVDDNSKSLATTEWFFGQAFNGVPQMDGVGSSGNSTLWARGNHRHPSDDTKIGDAPNDGKQYARQSQAWTVVSSSGGGGGGGVWIGDLPPSDTTTYPFWWSSASLQLSIWYNDGNSSQWVDTNAQPNAPTGPWLLQDGTVAAPGLAWASEPGLGWYRNQAGLIASTCQGFITSYIFSPNATTTQMVLSPRAPGITQFSLTNGANGAPNFNTFQLGCSTTGYGIAEQLNGTATSKPLTMTFPAGIALNPGPNSVDINGTDAVFNLNKTGAANYSIIYGYHNHSPRWNIVLGGAAANSGGNAGDDFSIGSFADNGAGLGTPLSINRASGVVSIPGLSAGVTTLGATTVQTNNTAVGLTIADFGNAGAGLAISAANGAKFIRVVSNILYYVNNANTQYIASLTDDGRFSPLAGYVSRPGSAAAPGANVFNFYWGAGLHAWVDSTDLGAISVTSDERIKRNIRPLDLHETEFMAIQPIEYEFDDVRIWTADGVNRWGFSAQNLVQAIPDSAAVINEETPMPTKAEDSWSPLNVDDRPILALTVRQVQDLITRVRALEAKL